MGSGGSNMAEQYVFWGGYAGNNIGDEAILWAMSQLIRRLDPAAEQHVLHPNGVSAAVEAQYTTWGINVVSGSLPHCLRILSRARLIVGGGQMVDESTRGWPIGWSSIFLIANRLSGIHPLVLCIGAEPLTKAIPRFLVRRAYGLADVITCRDEESSAVVRSTGVNAAKVWTTRDVVFSLDRTQLPQWTTDSSDGQTVAVLIAYDPNRILEKVSNYTELVGALRARGFRVELVAHDLREEYDVHALHDVKSHYSDDPHVNVAHATTVSDAFGIYSRVDAVISARMHPLIMGMLAGTLPVAFGGKAKVKSLLSMSGIPSIAGTDDPLDLVSQFETILAKRQAILLQLANTATAFRSNVEDATARALRQNRSQ